MLVGKLSVPRAPLFAVIIAIIFLVSAGENRIPELVLESPLLLKKARAVNIHKGYINYKQALSDPSNSAIP